MKVQTAFACLLICLGFPVCAQSSLGIFGATVELGSTEDETGTLQSLFSSSVDVRITEVHGLQGDLSFTDSATGTIGQLGGHLYMAPKPGQKYGLFVSLSDMDGRSMAWVSAGAEAMFAIGENTLIEGRLGLGASDRNSGDYIFGGISLAHAFTSEFEVELALDAADFDEAGFRATSIETSMTARYSPEGSPWGIYGSLTQSDLAGRNGAPAQTRIGAGVIFNFGASGGVSAHTRPFRRTDPVAPLVRRGIW